MIGWWVAGPVPAAVRRSIERLAAAGDVVRVAVMPDVHLAEDVCVGVALATRERVYPAAIGNDVGCGVDALPLGVEADPLVGAGGAALAARLLAAFRRVIPTERRGPGAGPPPPLLELGGPLDEPPPLDWSDPTLALAVAREGRGQLGTLGSGNHFLELARDDDGELWLLVHSGSRAAGHVVQRHHRRDAPVDPSGLHWLDGERRDRLLHDLACAEAWARTNRARLREAAVAVLGQVLPLSPGALLTCSHNHVRREGELFVHRKGAIPATAGEPGLIPGSMGAPSYVVEGRGEASALWSSSHGAGRAMSRKEAHQQIGVRELRAQMSGVWYDEARAARLVDEAPGAYKHIGEVMRAQSALTRIRARLRPVLNHKGV